MDRRSFNQQIAISAAAAALAPAATRAASAPFNIGMVLFDGMTYLDLAAPQDALSKVRTAKVLLLAKNAAAVINIDDHYGMELANTPGLTAELITYGQHNAAMVRAENIELTAQGTSFDFVSPWGNTPVELRILGLGLAAL